MTLVITVASAREIYQCADFRFTNALTGAPEDDSPANRKIFDVERPGWLALVAYCGIARTNSVNVSEWLVTRIHAIPSDSSFESLCSALLEADEWLAPLAPERRCHTFTVGAILGVEAHFARITNFEHPNREPRRRAAERLTVYREKVAATLVKVSGSVSLPSASRARLRALVESGAATDHVFDVLAGLNSEAAQHRRDVSPACFTMNIKRTGDSSARPNNIEIPAELATFGSIRDPGRFPQLRELLKGHRLVASAGVSIFGTREQHEMRVKDRPTEAHVHLELARFLLNKGESTGDAAAACERAIALDPENSEALRLLAIACAKLGRTADQKRFGRLAVQVQKVSEHSYAYALASKREFGFSDAELRDLGSRAVAEFPKSQFIHLQMARVTLLEEPQTALTHIDAAAEFGAPQDAILPMRAIAMQLAERDPYECIAAYRAAVAAHPKAGGLQLNMSQLFFMVGDEAEGLRALRDAQRAQLDADALIELHLYRLSYTSDDARMVVSGLIDAVLGGGSLKWNMSATVAAMKSRDPTLGACFERLVRTLTGHATVENVSHAAEKFLNSR